MIIELTGLPASGKTTIAKELRNHFDYEPTKITSRGELIWRNMVFITKYPLVSIRTLFYIFSNPVNPTILYYKFMNAFIQKNARYEKAKKMYRAVIDEGFFQNIYAIFEKTLSEKEILAYCLAMPKPDLLIILTPSKKELGEREVQRGYIARENLLAPEEIREWKDVAYKNHELFTSVIGKTSIPHIIHDTGHLEDLYRHVKEL